MNFSDKEQKLLRLALDDAAAKGEVENCAILFIRSLRKRHATIDEFLGADNDGAELNGDDEPAPVDWGKTVMSLGKHRGKIFNDIDPGYLRWLQRAMINDPEFKARYPDIFDCLENFLKKP